MPARIQKGRLGRALKQAVVEGVTVSPAAEAHAPGSGLLANPTRARVFQALLDAPMLHIAGVGRACRLSAPAVRWHLDVLADAGLVHRLRSAREARYFVTGTVDEGSREVLLAVRSSLVLPVLRQVASSPGRCVSELAQAVGASPQAVLRAAAALRALGLVESVRDGRHVRNYPTEGLERLVSRRSTLLPSQFEHLEAALSRTGETVVVSRRTRGEVVFQVGRRGARREFHLRADAGVAGSRGPLTGLPARGKPYLASSTNPSRW